jgi:DNA-binding response OmpR family regulator
MLVNEKERSGGFARRGEKTALRQRWRIWRQDRKTSASKASDSRSGSADPAPLRLDGLHRTVLRGNECVELSAREFRLLEALMQREGENCSRDELAELVWGSSVSGGSQLVDEYVIRLRAKLGGGVIEAVADEGYRYAAAR